MGYEKRLGGQMGLFARTGKSIDVKDLHLVVGSVHKVDAMRHQHELSKYFSKYNTTIGIVVAGDIDQKFCTKAGLVNLDMPRKLMTWPAECSTGYTGRLRGDNFCGSKELLVKGNSTVLPCFPQNETLPQIQISDHMIASIRLGYRIP